MKTHIDRIFRPICGRSPVGASSEEAHLCQRLVELLHRSLHSQQVGNKFYELALAL